MTQTEAPATPDHSFSFRRPGECRSDPFFGELGPGNTTNLSTPTTVLGFP